MDEPEQTPSPIRGGTPDQAPGLAELAARVATLERELRELRAQIESLESGGAAPPALRSV